MTPTSERSWRRQPDALSSTRGTRASHARANVPSASTSDPDDSGGTTVAALSTISTSTARYSARLLEKFEYTAPRVSSACSAIRSTLARP